MKITENELTPSRKAIMANELVSRIIQKPSLSDHHISFV